jgi:hypothetical protein
MTMADEGPQRSFPIVDQTVIANALARLSEPPHVHRWEILGVWRPPQPAHPRMQANAITIVLLRCRVCNWPETSELSGVWSEERVREGYRP